MQSDQPVAWRDQPWYAQVLAAARARAEGEIGILNTNAVFHIFLWIVAIGLLLLPFVTFVIELAQGVLVVAPVFLVSIGAGIVAMGLARQGKPR